MPLSSVLGAQSITKPGVCTSATRPSSPFDGQVIYETDTDRTLVWNNSAWVAVSYAVYSSSTRPASPYEGQLIYETDTDRVAAYNGSAWVYTATTDRILITSSSFSAVGAVTVDNVFTSTYRNYEIQLHITAQSSASGQIVKTNLRASGTSATGNNHHFSRSGYNWATGVINADVGNGVDHWFWARSNGSGSFEGRSGTSVILYGPQLAAMTTFTGTSVDGAYAAVIGGHHTLTTQYDGIGFSTTIAASTMTGTYRIYGLRD